LKDLFFELCRLQDEGSRAILHVLLKLSRAVSVRYNKSNGNHSNVGWRVTYSAGSN
jgi:hypothetical protein